MGCLKLVIVGIAECMYEGLLWASFPPRGPWAWPCLPLPVVRLCPSCTGDAEDLTSELLVF